MEHQRLPSRRDEGFEFEEEVLRIEGEVALAMSHTCVAHAGGVPHRGTLLLVHGFGQNRHAWHIPGRSFVHAFAREGWEVFNLDLRGHGASRAMGSRPSTDIDAYVSHDVPVAMRAALARTGDARVFLVGHSVGGLVSYAVAPRMRHEVAGVVTLGAPYAFGRGNRALLEAARAAVFATSRFERGARVPMRFVRGWFRRHTALWDHAWWPVPVRAWHPGSIERELLDEYLSLAFDGATFGELAHTVASGTRGRFASADGSLDYARAWEGCDVPTLIIAGARDLLAPVESVRPAYERSRARDKTFRTYALGHADLLLGREAPELTWPAVVAWLEARAARCTEVAR